MTDTYWRLAQGVFMLVGVIVAVLFLKWWRDKTHGGAPAPLQGQKIEAELLTATPAPSTPPTMEKRCRACQALSSLAGWRRPSTISVMGGVLGWSRRVRGLPPLYTRVRPAFGPEDLCAECSHVRDALVDKKIMEANLAIHSVGEQIAREVQRFMVSLDDDLRSSVIPADSRKRQAALQALQANTTPERGR